MFMLVINLLHMSVSSFLIDGQKILKLKAFATHAVYMRK